MCGLIFSYDLQGKSVVNEVAKKFIEQKDRGMKGFGFYLPEKDKLVHNTKPGRTLQLLKREKPSQVLFHHRKPTSTTNRRTSCHPFSTQGKIRGLKSNYIMIHNGMIRNSVSRRAAHIKRKINYISLYEEPWTATQTLERFNDSESLLWDLTLFLEGKANKIESIGPMAFIVVERQKGKTVRVHFGRNEDRPLKLLLGKTHLLIASEADCDDITPDKLFTYHVASNDLTVQDVKFERYDYAPTNYRGGWDDRYIRHITPESLPILIGWPGYGIGGAFDYSSRSRMYYLGRGDEVTKEKYIDALAGHFQAKLMEKYPDPVDAQRQAEELFTEVEITYDMVNEEDAPTSTEKLDKLEAEEFLEAMAIVSASLTDIIQNQYGTKP